MRFSKYIILICALILTMSFAACSSKPSHNMEHINLVTEINSHYYNLTNKNVKSIDFQYESLKFKTISRQTPNEKVAMLLDNIEFLVKWSGGTKISIVVNNEPWFKNKDARAGVKMMISGMKREIKGLFMSIYPAFKDLITYQKSLEISKNPNGVAITLHHKFSGLKEVFYFDNDYKLSKIETYNKEELYGVTNLSFSLVDGLYLLKENKTSINNGDDTTTTHFKIQYSKKDDLYIPYEIDMTAKNKKKVLEEKIRLIQKKVTKLL